MLMSPSIFGEEVVDTRSLFEKLVAARPLVSPSNSVTTPTAYGVGFGAIFMGVAVQTGTQYTGRPFGEYALGFGLGDTKSIAVTSSVTFGGIDEVIRDGNLNFQFSHDLSDAFSVAVGVENTYPWGADKRNGINSYGVITHSLSYNPYEDYCVAMILTLGIGNNRFVHNYETHSSEGKIFRPFGSVGIQILPQAAFIVDYVGLTYNVGVSIVPFLSVPLVGSLTAIDLTNRGGSRIPIAASIGYAYLF